MTDRTGGSDSPDEAQPISSATARTAPWCRMGATALVVIGAIGVMAWLWLTVRAQTRDERSNFLVLADGDLSVGQRIDLLTADLQRLLGSVAAIAAGLFLRLAADHVETVTAASPRVAHRPPVGQRWTTVAVGVVALTTVVSAVLLDRHPDWDLPFESTARTGEDRTAGELDLDLRDSDGSTESDLSDDMFAQDSVPLPSATLTVHSDGCGVIRTEIPEDVHNLTWTVKDLDGFQVLGRNAENETRYRYFQSGTYTVVLEGWDGNGYAPISNEVTITC